MDHGYKIEWAGERPRVPQGGRNPPSTEDSKIILDKEAKNMLKKRVFRLVNTSEEGVISGYFAPPKKA